MEPYNPLTVITREAPAAVSADPVPGLLLLLDGAVDDEPTVAVAPPPRTAEVLGPELVPAGSR